MIKVILQSLAILMLLGKLSYSQATVVLPVSLQKMSAVAELIFQGRVTDIEVRLDDVSNRVATYTTFKIIDVIKGDVGETYTVKQVGGKLPDSKVEVRIHGVPRFQTGNEYIVFLPQQSRLGFASPIGLRQGAFSITEKSGERVISNGRSIESLMDVRPNRSIRPAMPATGLAAQRASTFDNNLLKAKAGTPKHANLNEFKSVINSMVTR